MRIVHVSDGFPPRLGGIETLVHDLALAQQRAGHDVRVVTTTPGPGHDELEVLRPAGRGIHGSVGSTVDRALADRADVVHVHLSVVSPLAMTTLWQAAGRGRAVVATTHSLWGRAEPVLSAVRGLLGPRRHVVTWTAVSEAAARPLRRVLAVPVAVVPNGVDVAWWAAAPGPRPAGGPLRLLSVMRLTRRKRPLPLLRMVRTAAQVAGPVSLTVVGDGRQAGSVARAAHRGGGVDITLAGRLDRAAIRDLMSVHDLYVAPAPLESFGLAPLEARTAGLPVLGFRASGVADYIDDGRDGLLVDSDDELTEAIANLAGRPADVRALQEAARTTAPALGWSVAISGYESSYDLARSLAASVPGARVVRGAPAVTT